MCVQDRTPSKKWSRQKEEKERPLVTKHNNNIKNPGRRKTCQRLPPIHHIKKRATHNAEECPLPFSHSPCHGSPSPKRAYYVRVMRRTLRNTIRNLGKPSQVAPPDTRRSCQRLELCPQPPLHRPSDPRLLYLCSSDVDIVHGWRGLFDGPGRSSRPPISTRDLSSLEG